MSFSLKMLLSLMITLLIFGTMFTTFISYIFKNSDVRTEGPLRPALKIRPSSKRCKGCSDVRPGAPLRPAPKVPPAFKPCKGCSDVRPGAPLRPAPKIRPAFKPCKGCRESPIQKAVASYSQTWKKHQENTMKFRTLLRSKCQGFTKAIVTQDNTPMGAMIDYAYEKAKPLLVTSDIFNTFVKRNPFPNKTWDTCSVVGNGGILLNSSCGKMIDSAQFVIRCNLPPLEKGFLNDVGKKTDLVTANPGILVDKFNGLQQHHRPFMESMRRYNDALMLLPAFSFTRNVPLSLRAFYALEDFESPIRPVFLNPEYVQNLTSFWHSNGLNKFPTTGFMVTTLALELCNNVHLYGFWPFNQHPHFLLPLTNHYYDNKQVNKRAHEMPAEFDHLLRLHGQGVLKIHLGECGDNSEP